jgi:hypoxanthine phosphoribosyltransferase
MHPSSLSVCTLLDRPERRTVDINADYAGFTFSDHFVVGYGLDLDQKYRGLPEIWGLEPEALP